jgi:hypothetical protein
MGAGKRGGCPLFRSRRTSIAFPYLSRQRKHLSCARPPKVTFISDLWSPGGQAAPKMLEQLRKRWEKYAAEARDRSGTNLFSFKPGSVISSIFVVNCHRIVALRFEFVSE